jgi:hypothetical protein
MGQGVSSACCGRERFDGEGKDAPMMPLRRISCLQVLQFHIFRFRGGGTPEAWWNRDICW